VKRRSSTRPTTDSAPAKSAAPASGRRPEGSGRAAVRCIRPSSSFSQTWLKALVPDATSAVPRSVWKSRPRSIPESGPFVPATKPTKAVMTTNRVMRGFVSAT
jgi:hypothetical protein